MTLDRFWHWTGQLNPVTGHADPEREHRGTVVVLLGIVCLVAAVAYGAVFVLLGAWVPSIGVVIVATGVAWTLVQFRRHAKIGLAGHTMAASAWLALVPIGAASGGVAGAPTPWLIVPPMIAVLIGGRRHGAPWVAAGVGVIAILWVVVVKPF